MEFVHLVPLDVLVAQAIPPALYVLLQQPPTMMVPATVQLAITLLLLHHCDFALNALNLV